MKMHRVTVSDLLKTGEALAELEDLIRGEGMTGWQPIETAPKDGKPFLAWNGEVIDQVAWEWITKDKSSGWWRVQARGEAAEYGDFGRSPKYDEEELASLLDASP